MPLPPVPSESTEVATSHQGEGSDLPAGQGGFLALCCPSPGVSMTPFQDHSLRRRDGSSRKKPGDSGSTGLAREGQEGSKRQETGLGENRARDPGA